jgi:hypothetical protein
MVIKFICFGFAAWFSDHVDIRKIGIDQIPGTFGNNSEVSLEDRTNLASGTKPQP